MPKKQRTDTRMTPGFSGPFKGAPQQGTLFGYEVREYLLEKWGRTCAYCGITSVPLNIDHIHPRSKGGTDRVSNLTLACIPCNQAKGSQDVREFLDKDPKRLARIQAQAKRPLRDAAAVNSTRWTLHRELVETGLPVETGSGGLTKFNRIRFGLPKTHVIDALCTGNIEAARSWPASTLVARSTGRGSYSRTRSNQFGFPRLYLTRMKRHFGFTTGDLVHVCPSIRRNFHAWGRVMVRARGRFDIQGKTGLIRSINYGNCRVIARGDGWNYL